MKNDKPPLVVFFALPRQGDRIETAPGAHSFAIRHAVDTQV
ncbi:hypothetical protein ACQR5W_08475 [Xanthomonas sacchari]|nr:hypothetical protein [Xanthomonas sp. SHU 308]